MAARRSTNAGSGKGSAKASAGALGFAHPCTRRWFETSFPAPTSAQAKGWPSIAAGDSTLLLAPTGSGKTLAAFLVALDRLMFREAPPPPKRRRKKGEAERWDRGARVLYITPLKALGVDVERNLRAPLAGIRAIAERAGARFHDPSVGIRSGDTPQRERQRLVRHPPDVLITTPESLYLMLTSRAARILATVDTVILDEIHALVPTKRGAHLSVSLERLEALRARRHGGAPPPLQRIGLSATQRPLDEVARFLGGYAVLPDEAAAPVPRPVTIVDAGAKKDFDIKVEVPVEDMARLDQMAPVDSVSDSDSDSVSEAEPGPDPDPDEGDDFDDFEDDFSLPGDLPPLQPGPATAPPTTKSIWPMIHPRLVRLIRDHRSTMIFVNSRRLAERLAGAVNELAGEELALAHHGSLAKDTRASIEDRLKRGLLPAIIATSSLELGIDVGAVDLVIQIEAPLSVASGIQRIGRAGHQVGATSHGIIFPKYRGDLLACAAVTRHVREGHVEATHYPRNPLDVLAQQCVATCVAAETLAAASQSTGDAEPTTSVAGLYALVRGAAPYVELPRRSFEGVLDMLSGRYPSEQFAELRPRLTWDRLAGTLTPRRGARMLAIANAGTIPDRGTYGVFLATDERTVRVGELDEEMVFESREGDVFLLGATSWRIEEITQDRVLVTPAPGEPGKMPFWHGDRPGRPLEFGRAIGELTRTLHAKSDEDAEATLVAHHGLDERAARNLVAYLGDQAEATGKLPTDRQIVLERFVDEVGDWCVTLLSPFGARVHAPWVTAVQAMLLEEKGLDADTMWSDDGMVFRLPELDEPPDESLFFPDPGEVERRITGRVGETALFAARFRENAGRALLLPRKRPGQRMPLWAQRRKSASLLGVAAGFSDFPMLLETYRECLKDVFDVPGLVQLLTQIRDRKVKVAAVETRSPSPFASALLFNYVANFMYEGDAPLAERRAQALSLDHAQLRELLGAPELRELLDADAVREVVARLQRRDGRVLLKHADAVHDLLLGLGDQRAEEIRARCETPEALDAFLEALGSARRIVPCTVGGEARFIAVEDVARYRDALGIVPPMGVPQALLDPVKDPLGDLLGRYARTHGPFTAEEAAARFGLGIAPVLATLRRLEADGRVTEGELLPTELLHAAGRRGGREWVDVGVLRQLKRRSLAKLRAEVEPVEPEVFARFQLAWQGAGDEGGRGGLDALAQTVFQLQGAALPASALEAQILPARLRTFDHRDLDELCGSGEVLWRGVSSLGSKDGRVALYLAEHYPLLAPSVEPLEDPLAEAIREALSAGGALFFRDLVAHTGRLSSEVFEALWDLVWNGEVTNDSLRPLRSLRAGVQRARGGRHARRGLGAARARRGPPGSEGRWSLLPAAGTATPTERLEALTTQLLERYGVLTREACKAEGLSGGFSTVYPVLKAMEEAGRVRRGYFVAGLGSTQFALPGCEDRLRGHRDGAPPEEAVARVLAATDPASPWGAALPWPSSAEGAGRPQRAAGALVVLQDGALVGYVGRTGERLTTFLPEAEPERSRHGEALAGALARGEGRTPGRRGGMGVLIARIDDDPAPASEFAPYLEAAGFTPSGRGLFRRVGDDPRTRAKAERWRRGPLRSGDG